MIDLKKTWLPASYMDEVIPPPRDTPDAWIFHTAHGAAHLVDDPDRTGENALGEKLEEGAIVKFNYLVELGHRKLTVLQDGGYALHPPAEPICPEGLHVTVWIPGEHDTISDDVETMIENWKPGDIETIEFFSWSGDIPFTFANGHFVRAASAVQ